MPDLLQRITDFATRNLPPVPLPPIVEPTRDKPAPPIAVPLPTVRDTFVAYARAMVGGRYCSPPSPALYKKPRCTDCSGLVAWAYYQATGKPIPGNGGSHEQYNQAGRFLRRPKAGQPGEEWQPGDLLFYDTGGGTRAGNRANHVGVYIGNGRAVHAMNPDMGIVEVASSTAYWNQRFLNAKRLWEVTEPPPPDEPDPLPAGPKPVTTAAAPITPSVGPPVAFTTPFRAIKAITATQWQTILSDAQSPMEPEAAAIYNAAGPLITVAGAQSYKESQYGKAAGAPHNPLGLMELNGSTLRSFPSWSAAFGDWWRRITDSGYKSGVYMPQNISLEQYIVIYVGGPRCWSTRGAECGNGETWQPGGGPDTGSINLYLYQTKARINRYLGHYDPDPLWPDFEDGTTPADPQGFTAWKVEGATQRLYLPNNLPLEIKLTPAWRTCNRSGRKLNLTGTRQHETGNAGVGTGARMHADWQYNGTQGHPDGCVAVHGYVDDEVFIQTLPFNEQGIHSGDAGNQTQIAIELCVNADRDAKRAEANAAAVEAGILHMFGLTPEEDMWMHHENSGCPPILRSHWSQFEQQVRAGIDAIQRAL